MAPARLARLGRSRALRLALGGLASAALLYAAARNVSLAEFSAGMRSANPWYLAAALGSVALNTLAKAWRWKALLGAAGRPVPLARYLAALLIGQMLNILIPARLGELSRVALLGGPQGGAGPPAALAGSIVLEKLLDLALYAALCALVLALLPLPGWLAGPLYLMLALGGAAALAAGGTALLGRRRFGAAAGDGRLPAWRRRLARLLDEGLAAFRTLRAPAARLEALAWSALIWLTAALTNLLVLRALRVEAPALAALLLLVVLQAGVTLPSLPATIGVFEGLCVAALALFAVPPAPALSYGVLLHLVVLLPPVVAGLLCAWRIGIGVRPAAAG